MNSSDFAASTARNGFSANEGRQAGTTRTAVEYLARGGYVAKGIVYGTIGVFAVMTAFGFSGGRIVGTRSAMEILRSQPFGQVIVWVLVGGLLGYVVWRFVQAFLDPENKGSDAKGIVRRIGLAISGLSYATLAFFSASRLIGTSAGSGDGQDTQQSTATIMQYEWGVWLVGAFGLVMVGVGGYQGYRAYSARFKKHWQRSEMDPGTWRWATRISRFGIAARAVSFGLIGWFFLQASLQADPSEAQGLAGTLGSFADGALGKVWLGAIGTGFVCYGIYCAINARFKRIDP